MSFYGLLQPQDPGTKTVPNENLDVMLPRRRMSFKGLQDTPSLRDRVCF
jgi:hypothetical protein